MENNVKPPYRIYLDDVRTPTGDNWIVVRNYDEFVDKVNEIGLNNIDIISLDHDLGDTAMKEYFENVSPNYTLDYNNITEKTGALIAINNVTDDDDLMIINKSGLTIRMMVSDLRVMGRATQGVRLINIKGNDSIAAVTKVLREDEEVILDENGEINDADDSTDVDSSEEETQE